MDGYAANIKEVAQNHFVDGKLEHSIEPQKQKAKFNSAYSPYLFLCVITSDRKRYHNNYRDF